MGGLLYGTKSLGLLYHKYHKNMSGDMFFPICHSTPIQSITNDRLRNRFIYVYIFFHFLKM